MLWGKTKWRSASQAWARLEPKWMRAQTCKTPSLDPWWDGNMYKRKMMELRCCKHTLTKFRRTFVSSKKKKEIRLWFCHWCEIYCCSISSYSKSTCDLEMAITRIRRHLKTIASFVSLKWNIKMFQRSFPCWSIHLEPEATNKCVN